VRRREGKRRGEGAREGEKGYRIEKMGSERASGGTRQQNE
jgi:hypothetical protein